MALTITPRSITLRAVDGRRLTVPVSPRAVWTGDRARYRRGDRLILRLDGTGNANWLSLSDREQVSGRIRAVQPGRKELTLETRGGPVRIRIPRDSVLFKEGQVGNWLELHEGENITVMGQSGEGFLASSIFDAMSYVIHEFEMEHGPLLAQGILSSVNPSSLLEGTLTIGSLTVHYDAQTRWQLGARFTRPTDFQGIEALVFGPPGRARMVVSRRAIPFVYETLMARRR
ncbi:MAG: hypothetical protein AMXMBFR33_00690 [Candidatus Xenobia bacterium]